MNAAGTSKLAQETDSLQPTDQRESVDKIDGHGDVGRISSEQVPVGGRNQFVTPSLETTDPSHVP